MPSREEIAGWLKKEGDSTVRIWADLIGTERANEKAAIWYKRAAQVENMRCENCNFWDCYSAYSKTTGRCIMLGFSRNADFGCFSFESKEDSNNE